MLSKGPKSSICMSLMALTLIGSFLTTAVAKEGKSRSAATSGRIVKSVATVDPIEVNIVSVAVDNGGSLLLEFNLNDRKGNPIKGLTREEISAVDFGRLGYEEEVGLRTVVGTPRKVWLSYYSKYRENGAGAGSAAVANDGKDSLTENGDGRYTLKVNNPVRVLTKFSYLPAAETGVRLGIKRNDGLTASDTYYWRPATGKRIDAAKKLARQ